ncbi:efflux RND transporter periplasmic adaptor subunit [Aquabacterium sp. A08]|uniref:efflux RND transporter periplasmic adaptor subunit n=1 Tax=Aquabacterium sp. A08 TaxID=2718532 RepID=UPI0014207455|nr:HlyD family efflux transporter periplasmic adaptor subunit [Aquabacterium sp. A08]NIC42191.1 HlyD family efflux transporter periplasmic adaptor subunit [Aquabacterium sp. A08]NIC43609.1 HlyD family efflux transporter periplasmic adaptor subunit [Aquabacterium sp. A08]
MTVTAQTGLPGPRAVQALAALLDLQRRAREAASPQELGFLLVNDTLALAPYRQGVLWLADRGVYTLSGVLQPEANAPYGFWLQAVCQHLVNQPKGAARPFTAQDVPPELAREWAEWWPAHAVWLPMPHPTDGTDTPPQAGLLLVRDEPWSDQAEALLRDWTSAWWHAFHALHRPRLSSWRALRQRLANHFLRQPNRPWWRQNRVRWAAAVLLLLALPVRLTVLAPGELVPAQPVVVRAPLDGVLDTFHVQPNQLVQKNQPLFGFDEALIQSKLDVAQQTLATAETEYRQTMQLALVDAKYRQQLALLTGKIEEKRAEVDYLGEQLQRARVLAPADGVALFDDPAEWIGKPVAVGERIMRLAAPGDAEVEAWLPLADAVALPPDASVRLYLNASPLSPVNARLRYLAHDAVQRPDGSYAYRVRAALAAPTTHRVGLKGTAKLNGGWVPLGYWMLRRPLAWVRTTLGV